MFSDSPFLEQRYEGACWKVRHSLRSSWEGCLPLEAGGHTINWSKNMLRKREHSRQCVRTWIRSILLGPDELISLWTVNILARSQTETKHVEGLWLKLLFAKMVASPCRGETLASVLDGISMSFKSPVKHKRTLAFRTVELAMRVDRVHERVNGSEC